MNLFAEELKKSRLEAGYRTARSFFDWLKGRGIDFNYSYYMRLEQGALPSAKVVTELAGCVKSDRAERLVLAYCRSLFPKQAFLFVSASSGAGDKTGEGALASRDSEPAPQGQKELTLRQVAALAQSESAYHLFLLGTLARRPISFSETGKWLSPKALAASLRLLANAGLASVTSDRFEHTAVELRFPEAYSSELKEAYEKLDLWDESFWRRYGLEQLVNKMLVRRVSGRYLSLVRRQLDVLFELMKISDEVDRRYNENVLQLKVSLRQGKLPG